MEGKEKDCTRKKEKNFSDFSFKKPNKMPQQFFGSICLTDLLAKAENHSGITKANNGKVYAKINIWINDIPDEYGNSLAIKVSPSLEKKETEKGFYIGNCKKSEYKGGDKPVTKSDVSELKSQFSKVSQKDDSDLPF